MLSIDIYGTDLEKKTNHFINDFSNFNNKHIIQNYQKTKSNIPEESHYISSMTSTGFINGQDESNCYIKYSFQVLFLIIFLRRLIINIECDKIIENMDNIEDDDRVYIQKNMILQVIQKIFCEMLIGGRKIVKSDIFFKVTNIRANVRIDSSEFEGLLHEMVSKKLFMSQEICYINGNR